MYAGLDWAQKRGISTIETKKLLYVAETIYKRGDYLLALKNLKGMRIHSAKYQNKILMVIAEDKGRYHKFIYKISSAFDGCQVYTRNDISILETNFVVLDSGICAHIDQDGEIELFLNSIEKNDIKIVKSPAVSVDMKLFNKGTQTLFAKDDKLYFLKMK